MTEIGYIGVPEWECIQKRQQGYQNSQKLQKGKCAHCELFFKNGDLLEIDHKKPRAKGGKNTQYNLQLLHRHCHDTKTANDDKAVRGTNENSQIIEEPCEVKISRTVL